MKRKTKIVFVCDYNLYRSKMAQRMALDRLDQLNLSDSCQIISAGLKKTESSVPRWVDLALRSRGYKTIDDITPKMIQRADWLDADLVLTMNSRMNLEMLNWYKNSEFKQLQEKLDKKLRILPIYGLAGTDNDLQEISDPRDRLLTPRDHHSRRDSLGRKISVETLRILPSQIGNPLIYYASFGKYIPFTEDPNYRDRIIQVYDQTISQLEPCIEGAINRMQKEGYLG